MASSEEIRKRIQELGAKASFRAELATVKEVNEQEKTCSVSLISSGATLVNVRLSADLVEDDNNYCIQLPKVGSSVIVAQLTQAFWFVLSFGDLDKVIIKNVNTEMVLEENQISCKTENFIINEGENLGVVRAEELSKILTSINNFLTAFKGVLNTPVVTSAPGSPDAFHAAVLAATQAIQLTAVSADLINNKFKH